MAETELEGTKKTKKDAEKALSPFCFLIFLELTQKRFREGGVGSSTRNLNRIVVAVIMKKPLTPRLPNVRFTRAARRIVPVAALLLFLTLLTTQAQQIRWGLTVTNINNPITPIVVTNGDGSISITAGGGDTYGAPDSFTYAYQQVTGDFDIAVQIVNVTATDPAGQDSPKGSLMVRATLDGSSFDCQINALPLAPSGRDGQSRASAGSICPLTRTTCPAGDRYTAATRPLPNIALTRTSGSASSARATSS